MFRPAVLVLVFIAFSSASTTEDHSLETCLQRDSISCVQIHIYKKLRAILSQDTIDLIAGFRIVKEKSQDDGKSMESNKIDGKIYNSTEISQRQLILEDFIFEKLFSFFKHRTIQWNMAKAVEQFVPAARKLISAVPEKVKNKLINYVAEGRGKKKFMRIMFPVIIAFKMTVFTWVKVIYLGVALIAKKAIIISIIALCIAIFVAFKKHSYKEYRPTTYEIKGETIHSVPYYPVAWPSGGHSTHAVHSGHDSYDLHGSGSSPAHYLAYSAQKPNYSS